MSDRPDEPPTPSGVSPFEQTETFGPGAEQAAAVRAPHERYEVGGEVGRGGLGRVLRAYDRRLDRTVAIKELHRTSASARARFDRESVIAARLEHPGIVPVHDVGQWDDGRPFYAMKLVSGRPLRDVIDACDGLDERLALVPRVLAVAEAMAYAHQQGIIHRDLKPSNVILGAHGETIVIDWGLAKELGAADDEEEPGSAGPYRAPAGDGVTGVGEVMGTPAYMPPEQARGERVDERADVYALGAMLYHALTGALPYTGSNSHEVVSQVLDGPPQPLAEREPRVPHELAAIVTKAMARDPADRYHTAAGFEEDLRRFQTGRLVRAHAYTVRERAVRWIKAQRWPLTAAAMVALAGVATFALLRSQGAIGPSCAVPASALADAWSPAVSERVESAFAATGAEGAGDAFTRVSAQLDDYAGDWRQMRRQACEATHERGVQSEQVLDARMHCLDRRRDELAAFTETLASVESAADIAQAITAAQGLAPVTTCADVEALTARVPPPEDPAVRDRVAVLRAQLDRSQAQRLLGRYPQALELAQATVEPARETGHAPLIADALFATGRLQDMLDDYEAARDSFLAAAPAAARGRDDVRLANTWLELVELYADRLIQLDAAEALLPVAEAAVNRVSGDEALQARWHRVVGVLRWQRSDLDAAIDHMKRALALFERAHGGDHIETASMLDDLGILHRQIDDYEAAEQYYGRALAMYERLLGKDHVMASGTLNNLGVLYENQGKLDEAEQVHRRSLAMKIRVYGPDSVKVATTLNNLAGTAYRKGDYDKAIELVHQVIEIRERELGPEHDDVASALNNLGAFLVKRGDLEAAVPYLERSLSIREAVYGKTHKALVHPLHNLGKLALDAGDTGRAIERCQRALEVAEASLGPGHRTAGGPIYCLARAYAAAGQHSRAVTYYERTIELGEAVGIRPIEVSDTRFELAQVLWQGGQSRRAVSLARKVREEAKQIGGRDGEWLQGQVSEWLAERATP